MLRNKRKKTKMARFNTEIAGAFSGKIGPVVGYMWKNRACVRSYRKSINYPNTESQRNERDWFVRMVRFASRAKAALQLGYHLQADKTGMTEGNYFICQNKKHFRRVVGGVEVDYDQLAISEGTAADVLFHAPTFDEGEVVHIVFDKNMLLLRSSGDDNIYIYAYTPELDEGYLASPVRRRSRRVDIQLPETWAGRVVHLYGFVVDRDGRASNSTYIGAGMVNHSHEHGIYIPINKSWNDFVEISNREGFGSNDDSSTQSGELSKTTVTGGVDSIVCDKTPPPE